MPGKMTGWRAMRALMAADRTRLRAYFGDAETMVLQPGHIAAVLHRVAHCLYSSGWPGLARLVRIVTVELTGADIDPGACIGGGLVMPNPQAISIRGTLGENCTIMAHSSIGWVIEQPATATPGAPGPSPAAPILGRDVTLEPGALVLGSVRIGDGARIGARCLVLSDLPDGAEVPPLDWRAARH